MQRPSSFAADGRSAPVASNQRTVHPDLERVVLRHRRSRFRRPPAAHTVRAFAAADAVLRASGRPVILDSGCGTGESTRALAAANPHAFVIGVDKSAARLARATACERVLYVRAELPDLWRLAARHHWPVAAHFVLYPNPWPKRKHLLRRWHGHPAMTDLVNLGGRLELRTNWRIYAEEFAQTLRLFGVRDTGVSLVTPSVPLSAFERKYAARGHRLYRVVAELPYVCRGGGTGSRIAQNS